MMTASSVFFLLVFSVCHADLFVCEVDTDCTMDCRFTQCSSWTIDARTANSLTVLCGNSYHCKNTTILSSPNNDIHCNHTYSCNNLTVYYDYTIINNLNIDCSSDYSCQYIKIDSFQYDSNNNTLSPILPVASSSINLTCAGIYACHHATFNLHYIDNINILCDSGHPSSSSLYTACGALVLYPNDNTVFDTSYSNNVYVVCKSWDCFAVVFNASLSKYLSLICNNSVACGSTKIYPPYSDINRCNIHCNNYDNPCSQMVIYVNHNYSYNYLSISCHTAPYHSTDDTCSDITHTCIGDEYTHKLPSYTTQLGYDDYNHKYYSSSYQCCPWQSKLMYQSCNSSISKDCVIHCYSKNYDNCYYQLIDGRDYDSLTIYCSVAYTCQYAKILCPNNCNIICDGSHSCDRADIIYYHSAASISLQCKDSYSCYYTNIGTDSMDTILLSNENIYANISCLAKYSCYDAVFDFQNVAYVSFLCDYDYACIEPDLWCPANSIDVCNVTCIGDNSCDDMNIYVNGDYKYNYLQLNYDINTDSRPVYGVTFICDPTSYPFPWSYQMTFLITHHYSSGFYCSSLDCCPFRDIICLTKDCVIDCNDECFGKYIDASNATSLVLSCATPHSCESSTVICPTADDTSCVVECIAESSCADATIYGDKSYNNVTVYCFGYESCAESNILANYSNQVALYCMGSDTFYWSVLYANNANDVLVNVNGIGYQSMYQSTIYGKNVSNTFNISCKNTNPIGLISSESACSTNWYLAPLTTEPDYKKSTVTCSGYGCNQIYLDSINGTNDFNITYNGCNTCKTLDECMTKLIFQCGAKYSTVNQFKNDYTCWNNPTAYCSCNEMINSTHFRFISDINDSCPDYVCNDINDDCIIKCDSLLSYPTGCNYQLIDGTNSKSFTLLCNGYNLGCNYSSIYCPNGDCDVFCNSNLSCLNTHIYAISTTNLNIHCIAAHSCVNMSIYANFSKNINILCNQKYSNCDNMDIFGEYANNLDIQCTGTNTNCNQLHFYAQNIDSINLVCTGSHACNDMLIESDNAKKVEIYATGSNALYNGVIFVAKSQHFQLNCFNNDACNNPTIYPPHNTTIYCLGNSCYKLNLYITDSSLFKYFNISIDGCQYNDCMYINQCLNYWDIHCGTNYQSISRFYGNKCSNSNCNCNDLVNIATALFRDNMKMFNCSTTTTTTTLIPTKMPTRLPTNKPTKVPTLTTTYKHSLTPTRKPILLTTSSVPTNMPSILNTDLKSTNMTRFDDKKSENTSSLLIMIIIVIFVVVVFITGFIGYYLYSKKQKQKKDEKQMTIALTATTQ